ncbi:maleylpyruvate isomerase family mycothiol-dependent enzyme [Nocardioides sp.]|uniref:maleylpyruvate isomerase family mycothiol-dependent enzyme n=1 Tax=Nocardioides sp. TaxID=35761 RepID=UPI00260A7F3E|nr:maleylpyruvate isomerase family mycothiol-dependent enzyme [Nocardioides sp.]
MTTTPEDRAVAALRANHDTLAALVPTLSEEQLARPSGATEWTVAQVLSHLGSGAEIARTPIATAAGQQVEPEDNQSIWARWDASSPTEQAAGFVTHDAAYLDTVEALDPGQHDSLTIDLGFLPQPVPLVVALGMRLNEVANHAWDVRVAFDPSASVDADSAELLVELFRGPLAFLLGFSAHADQIERDVRLAIPGGSIEITDTVTVTGVSDAPTATFEGPTEAVVRLLSGRLSAEHAADVNVSGNVTLDQLRKVFPGY